MSKKRSQKGKAQYGIYETQNRFEKNKIRKMKRACKAQPNNLELRTSLDKVLANGCAVSRKRPINSHWTPSRITFAKTIALCGVNGNLALIPTPLHGGDKSAQKSREVFKGEWNQAHRLMRESKPGFFTNK